MKYTLFALCATLAALRLSPALARWMLANLSAPALVLLHRLTSKIPFPAAELLALALLVLTFVALCRALARRSLRPLRLPLRLLFTCLLALALLWGPALTAPLAPLDFPAAPDALATVPAVQYAPLPAPDAARLSLLCQALIDRLNASPLDFPATPDALAMAPAVAGLPARAVKAARFPGWMALARAWGMFIPLTGEALVDPSEPAPLVPFTAVHELMHLSGIADEGAANVAAWKRCMAAGGPFADSARLWALRYAMGRLRSADPAAWQSVQYKMEDALMRTFLDCGAEAESISRRLPLTRGDYAALVGYLSNGYKPYP